MTMLTCYIIPLCLINHFLIGAKCFDIHFQSSKVLINSTFPGYGNVTLKRTKHEYPRIFAEAEVLDTGRTIDFEGKLYHSPIGNQRFILLPLKIVRQPVCDVLNKGYRELLMNMIKDYSNLPFSEDPTEDLCDQVFLGHYYVRNFTIDTKIMGALGLLKAPMGRYRAVAYYYVRNEKKAATGFEVVVRLD